MRGKTVMSFGSLEPSLGLPLCHICGTQRQGVSGLGRIFAIIKFSLHIFSGSLTYVIFFLSPIESILRNFGPACSMISEIVAYLEHTELDQKESRFCGQEEKKKDKKKEKETERKERKTYICVHGTHFAICFFLHFKSGFLFYTQ